MITPVRDATAAIAAYHSKPGNEVGGNLHIVLDNPNYDDESVRFCLEQAHAARDDDGVRLAELLLRLTELQRELAVDAYWDRPAS